MNRFTRRRFLAATGVAAAAGAARQLSGPTSAQAAPLKLELEKGAVLHWKRFVRICRSGRSATKCVAC
jgi:hypothetical protein